jgi:hypothetical protein
MPVYQIIDNQDNLGLSSGFPCTVPMQEMSVIGISIWKIRRCASIPVNVILFYEKNFAFLVRRGI